MSGTIRGNFFTTAVSSCIMVSMCSVLRRETHIFGDIFIVTARKEKTSRVKNYVMALINGATLFVDVNGDAGVIENKFVLLRHRDVMTQSPFVQKIN